MSPNSNTEKWLKAKVIAGHQIGRKINLPTINLNNPEILNKYKKGVYSALVRFKSKVYKGSLYFGPRTILGETKNIMEIYIFDFNRQIYNRQIEFQPVNFIRPPKIFKSMGEMKETIEKDNQLIRGKI